MTDGIIKGTGNSRYLKSVANAKLLYPTWEDALDALVAGTFPIDLNGINPAGWDQLGMKLDKANLLTDTLCTALGLSAAATPTQAIDKLRQLVETAQSGVNNGVKIATGSYVGTGTYGVSGQTQITFPFLPKLILVQGPMRNGSSVSSGTVSIFPGVSFNRYSSDAGYGLYTTVSGTTVSWYVTDTGQYAATGQLNSKNTYDYIAIG